jgi:hypothetical protein
MLVGLKTVFVSFAACTLAGTLLGVLIGALTGALLVWTAVFALIGFGFGAAIAYGFLPEE